MQGFVGRHKHLKYINNLIWAGQWQPCSKMRYAVAFGKKC